MVNKLLIVIVNKYRLDKIVCIFNEHKPRAKNGRRAARGVRRPARAAWTRTLRARPVWTRVVRAGAGPTPALRREFAGVEIDRTGDHHPFYWDDQDIAPLDALIPTASCAPAVAEEALEVATVAPRPTASASRACPRRTAIPAPTGPGSAPPAATRSFP